jgi:hypothetical protein
MRHGVSAGHVSVSMTLVCEEEAWLQRAAHACTDTLRKILPACVPPSCDMDVVQCGQMTNRSCFMDALRVLQGRLCRRASNVASGCHDDSDKVWFVGPMDPRHSAGCWPAAAKCGRATLQ